MANSSLAKLAAACLAVSYQADIGLARQGKHPLHGTPDHVQSITRPDGGVSLKMTKQAATRQPSRADVIAKRQQRATNLRIQEQHRNSWSNTISRWLGLSGTIAEEAMPITRASESTYTVQLTAGTTPLGMTAVVDTALAWTVLETTDCSGCGTGSDTVDTATEAGVVINADSVSGELNNPGATYSGSTGTATVCLYDLAGGTYATAPDAVNVGSMPCAEDAFVHYATAVDTPNTAVTAYLGMALGLGRDSNGNQPNADEMFMDKLETDGRVDSTSKLFAMGIYTDDSEQSFMDLGTTTSTALKSGTTKASVQFDDNEYLWKTPLNGIWFGGYENSKYGLKADSITLETSMQCLQVPSSSYGFVYNRLMYYSTGFFVDQDGNSIVDCGDIQNMQSIQLLMNDQWVNISPVDYLIPIETTYNGELRSTGMCQICVEQSPDSLWHVGTVALTGYYAEFDFSTRQVGLTPLATGVKTQVESGEKPSTELGASLFTILFLSLGILVTLGVTVVLFLAAFTDTNIGGDSTARASIKKAGVTAGELEVLIKNALHKQKSKDAETLLTANALN